MSKVTEVKLQPGPTNKYQLAVRSTLATPHIPWAKPGQAPPVKALFFMPDRSARVVTELTQRLSLEPEALWIGHYPADIEARLSAIDEFLAKAPDLLFVGKTRTWGYLPEANKKRILEQVANGMGLVLVWATPDPCLLPTPDSMVGLAADAVNDPALYDFIFDSPFFDEVPVFKDYRDRKELASFYTLGKGRIVLLHAESGTRYASSWSDKRKADGIIPPYLPLDPAEGDAWEYHYVVAIRAILWATGRTPQVRVLSGEVDTDARALSITLANQGRETDVQLDAIIKNEYGETIAQPSVPATLPVGTSKASLQLPKCDPGNYWANVIVRDRTGVSLGFGACKFSVRSPLRIMALALDREYYEVGQEVRVSAQLDAEVDCQARCSICVVDTFGREVERKQLDISLRAGEPHQLSFKLTCSSPVACLHTVWFRVESNGRLLARRAKEFTVVGPDRGDDYRVKIWNYPLQFHYDGLLLEQMRKHGIDTVIISGNRGDEFQNPQRMRAGFRFGVLHNMRVDPINTGLILNSDIPKANEATRPNCVNNPQTQREFRRQAEFWAELGKRYAPCVYLLGDEMHYADAKGAVHYNWCRCEYCLPLFRQYLHELYGRSIAKLNAEWGKSFGTWEEVTPMSWDDAVGRGNYAPWLDHRIFSENTYMDERADFAGAFRQIDPYARIGISGFAHPTIWTGENWPRTLTRGSLAGWSPYWQMDNECLWLDQFYEGDTRPRVQPWVGYDYQVDHETLLEVGLFYGFNGTGLYSVVEYFKPNCEPGELMLKVWDEIRELKAGITTLILNASRPWGPVATHFPERAGVMINAIQQGNMADEKEENYEIVPYYDSLPAAVKGFGLWPRVVTAAQVERGILKKRGVSVLLTGYLPAVSDKELDQLEKFVADGGILLVCYRFAVFDEHGAPREGPKAKRVEDLTGVQVLDPAHKACDLVKLEPSNISPTQGGQFGALKDLSLNTYTGSNVPNLHHLKVLDGAVEEAVFAEGPLARQPAQPAIVRHKYKAGTVYYFNGYMQAHAARENYVEGGRLNPERASAHRLVRTILEKAQIHPDLKPRTADGNWYEGFTVARFQQGGADYFGFASEPSSGVCKPVDVTFDLSVGKRHLYHYDVTNKKQSYIGETDSCPLSVSRPETYLLAAMPYKINVLSVATRNTKRGKNAVVNLALSKTGKAAWADHVVSIKVTDAKNQERPEYSANTILKNGRGTHRFAVALNDPTGDWRIEARERVSGKQAEAQVSVQ